MIKELRCIRKNEKKLIKLIPHILDEVNSFCCSRKFSKDRKIQYLNVYIKSFEKLYEHCMNNKLKDKCYYAIAFCEAWKDLID